MKISTYIFLTMAMSLLVTQNLFAKINCDSKEVFVGRYFGLYQQVKVFKENKRNYEVFKQKAFESYSNYLPEIGNICKKHRALVSEATKRNLAYPKITSSQFTSKYLDKINGVLQSFIDSGLNYRHANEAFVTKAKQMGFPHDESMDIDEIYRRIGKVIEVQLKEEIRDEQITQLEQLLFNGKKDPLIYMSDIGKNTTAIEQILRQKKFHQPEILRKNIKKFNLRSLIDSTTFSPNELSNIKASPILESKFIDIALKNINMSIDLYVKFVLQAKNAQQKLENFDAETLTPDREIIKLLYQSKINNEDRFLQFIDLKLDERKVFDVENLEHYPSMFSYLRNNCPKLYEAINKRVHHVIEKLLSYPSFAVTHITWKNTHFNEIYKLALDSFNREQFQSAKNNFYLREGINAN